MYVLFLCTGNSCLSILGEGTFNHLAPAGLHAMSAGSKPAGYAHPRSLALLTREGISTDAVVSQTRLKKCENILLKWMSNLIVQLGP